MRSRAQGRAWTCARQVPGPVVLGVLLWRTGTDPFVRGVGAATPGVLLVGLLVGTVVTGCCAWRWRAIGQALGAPVAMTAAVGAVYRSQFLNSVLPGGVVGDVDRGVRHGRETGDLPRSLRVVVWDRVAGQVVQVALAVVVLLALPSPVPRALVLALGVTLTTGVLVAARHREPQALLTTRTGPGIVVASTVAVVGHVATFLVAARSAGVTVPTLQLLPLALVVLLAMGLPVNIAGWGPREGAAAWAFAAAGLGAEQGLATAVVYGVVSFVAGLPGLVVLVHPPRQRASARPRVAEGVAIPVRGGGQAVGVDGRG